MNAHNANADTFSRTSNTQRENRNAIFTSEKLEKLDKLANTLKDFTINYAEYYVSNSSIANERKGDPASDLKTVIHTSDRKRQFTDTSKRKFQQKLLSNRTLPFVVLTMDTRIDDRIATI